MGVMAPLFADDMRCLCFETPMKLSTSICRGVYCRSGRHGVAAKVASCRNTLLAFALIRVFLTRIVRGAPI